MKYKYISLDENEKLEVSKWIEKHGIEHVIDDEGAIGGRFSIKFTLTSIGPMLSVNCLCGASHYIHRDL